MCAFTVYPLEQAVVTLAALYLGAGGDTLTAFGTGEHFTFQGAWLEAHRAGIVTGVIAALAGARATRIEADDHGFGISHPYQALKQAHGTGKAAEQVAR